MTEPQSHPVRTHELRAGSRRFALTAFENDHIGTAVSKGAFYEADLLRLCRSIHIPGTTILDVGANIGNHTVYFAGVLGAEVVAFEPNPPVADLLEANVAQNALGDRVTVVRAGAGAETATGAIYDVSTRNWGVAKVRVGEGSIPITTLNKAAVGRRVSLIKIDVEGMEPDVLTGAGDIIAAYKPNIFLEAKQPGDFWAVARIMLDHGYHPSSRVAATPTYLFTHPDQTARLRALDPGA